MLNKLKNITSVNGLFTGLLALTALTACNQNNKTQTTDSILFKHVTLIDGNGGTPVENTDMLVQADTIAAIGPDQHVEGVKVIDLAGKTMMPSLICAHAHIGSLKGTTNAIENYTRDNIMAQLKKYEDYGLSNVLIMGSDFPMLFESGLRDSSIAGLLPGAKLHSAGHGFGVPQGAPPPGPAFSSVYRPTSTNQIAGEIDSLVKLNVRVVKMWVDDFGGKFTKMDPSIYKTVIEEAHKKGLKVASHLYYLSDAQDLVKSGLDIIAHSIRDKEVDDDLLKMMAANRMVYIPTLTLDEYAFIYANKAEWINDDFFKASLEPGVYEMITSNEYQEKLKNSPDYARNEAAYKMSMRNLKKIADAGITIALGSDSGATPIRTQGFSEHLELELMTQAGLTPMQAITAATKNAAAVLQINDKSGTLTAGKTADFIILGGNPAIDIKNTRKIESVYKAGKEVSKGPLSTAIARQP